MALPLPSEDAADGVGGAVAEWRLTSFSGLVQRLTNAYPEVSATEIEAIVLRENDAFTGGRPLVVPVEIEDGANEILGFRRGAASGA